jgi:hypothetical protein
MIRPAALDSGKLSQIRPAPPREWLVPLLDVAYLQNMFVAFALLQNMAFRYRSRRQPNVKSLDYLSVCTRSAVPIAQVANHLRISNRFSFEIRPHAPTRHAASRKSSSS